MSPREDLLKSAGRPVPGALRVGTRDRTSGIVLRVRTRLFAAFVGIAACVPFFDTAPTGTVVADLGSGDSGADVVDTGPTVFPTEDGWQCGEFEIRTSPQAGELCGDLMECPQGLCLVVDNTGQPVPLSALPRTAPRSAATGPSVVPGRSRSRTGPRSATACRKHLRMGFARPISSATEARSALTLSI